MAIYTQVGRQPITGADRSMKNYSVTDIPPNTGVTWDTATGHINGCIIPATSAGPNASCGITVDRIPAGKTGRVAIGGTATGNSNATLAAGDVVDIDTTSGNEGKIKAHASGAMSLGFACHACVAGDAVEVLVQVSPNA